MGAPDLTPEQMEQLDRMVECVDSDDLYGLLGVEIDADANAIQAAYYALSRNWHPDRFFRKELGEYAERLETAFVGVTQAYKTLTDPVKRKAYDRANRERIDKLLAEKAEAAEREERRARREGRQVDVSKRRSSRGPSVRERLARNAQRRSATSRAVGQRLRRRMMDQMRQELGDRIKKARTFFEAGKADYEAGRVVKASSSLELAVRYDPDNDEYRELNEVVQREARKSRVIALVAQGEQAESYQQYKQAIHSYRQAAELEPPEGKVYYRLARLVRADEGDEREALRLLRLAVSKSPDSTEYRLGLGNLYKELGMRLNARREFQAVLDQDKGNAEARAALKEL